MTQDDGKIGGVEVVLGLGSNCGDRKASVAKAISSLKSILKNAKASRIYETQPVGHSGSTNYMNAVVSGIFTGDPEDLEGLCKDYELREGRDAEARAKGLVPIDIDIVIAAGNVIRPRDFKCAFFQTGYRQINK